MDCYGELRRSSAWVAPRAKWDGMLVVWLLLKHVGRMAHSTNYRRSSQLCNSIVRLAAPSWRACCATTGRTESDFMRTRKRATDLGYLRRHFHNLSTRILAFDSLVAKLSSFVSVLNDQLPGPCTSMSSLSIFS